MVFQYRIQIDMLYKVCMSARPCVCPQPISSLYAAYLSAERMLGMESALSAERVMTAKHVSNVEGRMYVCQTHTSRFIVFSLTNEVGRAQALV